MPISTHRRLFALALLGSGAVFLFQCGGSGDDSVFHGSGDGGDASVLGSSSGFTTTVCDGAPCATTGDDSSATTGGCGDGNLAKSEACDDGNVTAGDGCSATCTIENGWACPTPGIACVAAKCGDGIVAPPEECENSGGIPTAGCDANCKITPGYDCNAATFTCMAVVCGDGIVSRGETCEDGNNLPFDGCYNCQKEPACANGVCVAACGDGQRFATEACDDGNNRSGDGCSADCKVETGYKCTDIVGSPPDSIPLPLLVRDFIGVGNAINGATAHPDFNMRGGSGILNIVEPDLDPDGGRMVLNCPGGDCTKNPGYSTDPHPNITNRANFDQWYRANTQNIPSVVTLPLKRTGTTYVWDSNDGTQNPNATATDKFFDPIGTGGWVDAGKEQRVCNPLRNVSWTTETHFWFEYQGGEQFQFSGDDDTWVFVNGVLALDLGGLHNPLQGTVTLDAAADAGAGAGGETFTSNLGGGQTGHVALGLTVGGIYEIAMFQAERNQCGSNFKVTFKDFNKPKSACASTCGDGVRASDEVCDDGKNDGSYGGCMPGCLARGPRCGDGVTQSDHGEQCDDGNTDNDDACTNGCRTSDVK